MFIGFNDTFYLTGRRMIQKGEHEESKQVSSTQLHGALRADGSQTRKDPVNRVPQ